MCRSTTDTGRTQTSESAYLTWLPEVHESRRGRPEKQRLCHEAVRPNKAVRCHDEAQATAMEVVQVGNRGWSQDGD